MASRAPWAAHFGLARTPFGKAIAAKDLFARQAHAEAIARISFCIAESRSASSRATPAPARRWPSRRRRRPGPHPAPGHLHRQPGLRIPRPVCQVVRALGARPRYLKAELMDQAADLLAAETAERHRTVVVSSTRPICYSPTSWRNSGS